MLNQGIHYDVPSAEYFADPAPEPSLTQSIAKVLIEQSPAHARLEHPRLSPQTAPDTEYTKARAIGNAAHKLLLNRGKEIVVPDFDNWRSKEAQKLKADAIQAGKEVILAHHFVDAQAMVTAAREQLRAAGLEAAFADNRSEVVAICQEDGIWLRTMIDYPNVDFCILYDFKTSAMSVAPHNIPNLMANAGWAIQAAMQERILDTIDPECAGRRVFRFVAQENFPPFALTVCELPESTMTLGRKQLAHAIDLWRECMTSGQWPSYPRDIVYPNYPGYRETQWLEREMTYEERRVQRGQALESLMGG